VDFAIDEDVSTLVAAVADFFKRRDDARAIASAAAKGPAGDCPRWSALCQLGLPAFRMPEPFGMAAGLLEAASLAEQLGAVLLPEPATASLVLTKLWSDKGGSSRLLDAVVDGSAVVQFAALSRLELSGTVSGELVMFDDGITDMVAVPASGTESTVVVILDRAQFPPSCRAEHVDPSRPAVWYQLDGIRPVDMLHVDDAAIDRARREASLLMAGELVGGMQTVLTATIGYVRERQQFGRSIGSFQAVKHRVADMYVAVEQARAAVQFAAVGCDADSEDVSADVAASTRWVPDAAIELFDNAIHLHGAMGYAWELDVHLHLRRALATRSMLNRGSNA
jgi:alkylation response protein AidB-like acyl-CoA dehydrogenase